MFLNICHAISRVLSLIFLGIRANHLSSPPIAWWIKRFLRHTNGGHLLLICLLAASRVYLASQSPAKPVGSYPTLFTIAFPFTGISCVVSVALSLRLLLVAVSNCFALCRPDFPLAPFTGPAVSYVADVCIIAYFVLLGRLMLY